MASKIWKQVFESPLTRHEAIIAETYDLPERTPSENGITEQKKMFPECSSSNEHSDISDH